MDESDMEKELREIEEEEEILSTYGEKSIEYQFDDFRKRYRNFSQNIRTLLIIIILIGITQTGLMVAILLWIRDILFNL